MARLALTKNWWRVAGVLALPSCMVSFNDYPVGPLGPGKSDGGTSASGSNTGGSASPTSGSENGGTVTGGTSAGNSASGNGGASGGMGATAGTGATAGGGGSGGIATGGSTPMGGTDTMPGGAPSDGGAPTQVESPMIDDFEDGDGNILVVSGRTGTWYTSNDGTGMQTPKPGDALVPAKLNPVRGSSLFAARITGSSFNTWGSLLGTPLLEKNGVAYPYDVSGYKGIRFWARNVSNTFYAARKLRVALPMTGTVPGTGCTTCNDHFSLELDVGANWAQLNVPFSLLKQQGFGKPLLPSPPDMKHVIFFEITVGAHVVYDLYIDDVELY